MFTDFLSDAAIAHAACYSLKVLTHLHKLWDNNLKNGTILESYTIVVFFRLRANRIEVTTYVCIDCFVYVPRMASWTQYTFRTPIWELGFWGGQGWTTANKAIEAGTGITEPRTGTDKEDTLLDKIQRKKTAAKWIEFHPLRSYYCCDGCGLILHDRIPGCTLHAVESRFCSQCGTFYSPTQAGQQKGRYALVSVFVILMPGCLF